MSVLSGWGDEALNKVGKEEEENEDEDEEAGKEEGGIGRLRLPGACVCEDKRGSCSCWKAAAVCLVFEEGLALTARASTTTADKCNITSSSTDTHLSPNLTGWAFCVAETMPVFGDVGKRLSLSLSW